MINPTILYRIYRKLYIWNIPKAPSILCRLNYFITGCHIPPPVELGNRVQFTHFGSGVIFHNQVRVGDDTLIMPGVLIGQNVINTNEIPTLEMITIGNKVLIGAGAKIIATRSLTIGPNCTIGAGAVVTRSIPPGDTVVGIPARTIPPRNKD